MLLQQAAARSFVRRTSQGSNDGHAHSHRTVRTQCEHSGDMAHLPPRPATLSRLCGHSADILRLLHRRDLDFYGDGESERKNQKRAVDKEGRSMNEAIDDTISVKHGVHHETPCLTPKIAAQVELRRAGMRRKVHHCGLLCSRCLENPPAGPNDRYCRPCRAADRRARRAASSAGVAP